MELTSGKSSHHGNYAIIPEDSEIFIQPNDSRTTSSQPNNLRSSSDHHTTTVNVNVNVSVNTNAMPNNSSSNNKDKESTSRRGTSLVKRKKSFRRQLSKQISSVTSRFDRTFSLTSRRLTVGSNISSSSKPNNKQKNEHEQFATPTVNFNDNKVVNSNDNEQSNCNTNNTSDKLPWAEQQRNDFAKKITNAKNFDTTILPDSRSIPKEIQSNPPPKSGGGFDNLQFRHHTGSEIRLFQLEWPPGWVFR